MASSGQKTVAFCSRNGANRFYLQWSWNATQSVPNNQSTVKVILYLGSYGNGYGMNASATKSGTITINGNTKNFTTAGISLSSGGKIKLAEHSVTITHDANGAKSFAINASYNPSVTISGTSQGNVSMGSTTYTLDTIARASTISCTGKWTFPNNHTISISRKSSSFTHTVRLYVKDMSNPLKTWTKTASTSFSTSFSTTENTTIASRLGTGSATPSVATKIEVDTYSGSTKIGSTATVSGTCTATTRSTTTFTNNFNIGATVSGKITENNGAYTHSLNISDSSGAWIADILVNSTTLNWTFDTNTIASKLYAKTPNANSYTGKIKLYTKYNGTQVGNIAESNWTWKVTNSNPTFAPTVTYSDTNSNITAKTGNAQYIVQNKSNLTVVCTGNATAKNSATMKTIQCTVAGKTLTQNWSSGATSYTFNFGTINASSNQSCSVIAVDSRGNKTTVSKTVTCLPYSAPKLVLTAERLNKFSTTVNVNIKGTYSVVNVGGTFKNTLSAYNSYIKIDSGTESSAKAFTMGWSNGNYWSTAANAYTVAETSIAMVRVVVTDSFGSSVTASVDISTGLPTMFVDADKGNISFNALPNMSKENNMVLGMQLDAAKNQYWTQGSGSAALNVAGNYGINMNNSDLVGLSGLFFNDICDATNHNEGIFFVNSGNMSTAPSGSGFSRMYIRDGHVWVSTGNTGSGITSMVCIGNSNMMTSLWEGGYYMTEGHTVTPSKSLSNCPTGWVLAWSDYDSSTGTKNNFDWVFQLIPKQTAKYSLGTVMQTLPVGLSDAGAGTWVCKKLTISNTQIIGHNLNNKNTAQQADVILRHVFMV